MLIAGPEIDLDGEPDALDCCPPITYVDLASGETGATTFACRKPFEPICADFRLATLVLEPAARCFACHRAIYITAYRPGSHAARAHRDRACAAVSRRVTVTCPA